MPVVLHQLLPTGGEFSVWKITESTDNLIEILQKHKIYPDIPFFRNPARLAEWLAVRVLFSELGVRQRIVYDDSGKPHLEGEGFYVSISHSKEYVAVIVSKEHKVGIDIEKTGDRIFKVSHKFVSDTERKWISEEFEMEQLYVIWGAKECAFKIFGLGAIDFRDHLEVQPFDFKELGATTLRFTKDENSTEYRIFYQYLNDVLITYAIAL